MCRAPGGLPRVADIGSQHEGFASQLGRLQSPERSVARPTEVPDGCIVDGGDRDRGEVPRAQEASEVPGITTVGCDPVAGLLRNQGGRDAPAGGALLRQGPLEPGATGASVVDEDQLRALGLQRPDARVDSTLPRPNRAAGDDIGAICLGHRGDGDGLCMDIHAHVERARLCPG